MYRAWDSAIRQPINIIVSKSRLLIANRRFFREIQLARTNKGTAIARRKKDNDSALVSLEAKRKRLATPTVPQETEANTMSEKSRRKLC